MSFRDGRQGGNNPTRERQGHWTFNQSSPLDFTAPNPLYNATTAITGTHWRTPTFDLRYNLGDVDGFGQRRQKNIEDDVLLGINYHLFIGLTLTFTGAAFLQFPAFKWYALEFGNQMDANKLNFFESRLDISSQVYSGYVDNTNAITARTLTTSLIWLPSGPIRYWGVAIMCDQVLAVDLAGDPITAPPSVLVTGALH